MLAEQGVAAAKAGAAILHVHARDAKDGRPTPDPAMYLAFLPPRAYLAWGERRAPRTA